MLLLRRKLGPFLPLPRFYQTHNAIFGANQSFRTRNSVELPKQSVTDNENCKQIRSWKHLIDAYRLHGYRQAHLDPLNLRKNHEIVSFGGTREQANFDHLIDKFYDNIDGLESRMKQIYCGGATLEAGYIDCDVERNWIFEKFEKLQLSHLETSVKLRILEVLSNGEQFDTFTAAKFPTVKRYGGEGAESMLVFCDSLFTNASKFDIDDIVVGIAHRGRNNLLTVLLECPPALLFRKMKGFCGMPESLDDLMDDDVLSHIRMSTDLKNKMHISLLPNPSHLEAVNPVCIGKTRSKQMLRGRNSYESVSKKSNQTDSLCLLIHGDGAFAGQGVVAECFNMAYVPHYDVGGTVHLITNNQLGFTMEKRFSCRHTSDVSRMINCPVVHVNVDYPEDVYKAAILCSEYRSLFKKDIVCNLHCYRKWGHNEMDDPYLTQPVMYSAINSRDSVPQKYWKHLENKINVPELREVEKKLVEFKEVLNSHFSLSETFSPSLQSFGGNWKNFNFADKQNSTWNTGVDIEVLKYVGAKSVTVPEDFNAQPKLMKTLSTRLDMMKTGSGIDWATAEVLALGSLMLQGHNVRISGQEVGRGTFSQRHVQLTDQSTDLIHIPLNFLASSGDVNIGKLEVANSILSEEAVLGFEYGFSLNDPNSLVIWEAQFGDFFNGAQIIIDTFVTSGERKWGLQSGLVMLLPHGLDGMGPEHSSCRVERFLQQSDSSETEIDSDQVNMFIVNPTTPAQLFHLLRQQQVRNFRKPLIVVSAKKLLRLPEARSNFLDFEPGTFFSPVIGDNDVNPNKVRKLIIVSGKFYYSLMSERQKLKREDVAVVRVEQLVPFPTQALQLVCHSFSNCQEFVWCQEEHRNSGAWSFVEPRFRNLVGLKLQYVGRSERAVPATAIATRHKQEELDILNKVFRT